MKIGMGIPETGPQATRPSLDAWIERAEALLAYRHLGITHLQSNMDQMTTAAIQPGAGVARRGRLSRTGTRRS